MNGNTLLKEGKNQNSKTTCLIFEHTYWDLSFVPLPIHINSIGKKALNLN